MAILKLKKDDEIYQFPDEKYQAILSAFIKWTNTKEDTFITAIPNKNIRASDIDKLYTLEESKRKENQIKLREEINKQNNEKYSPLTDEEKKTIARLIEKHGKEIKENFKKVYDKVKWK